MDLKEIKERGEGGLQGRKGNDIIIISRINK